MLVLQRKLDERIVIEYPGQPLVTIDVVRLKEGTVRLGIDAPREVAIHRQEVYDRIQAQKGI